MTNICNYITTNANEAFVATKDFFTNPKIPSLAKGLFTIFTLEGVIDTVKTRSPISAVFTLCILGICKYLNQPWHLLRNIERSIQKINEELPDGDDKDQLLNQIEPTREAALQIANQDPFRRFDPLEQAVRKSVKIGANFAS